MTVAPADRVSLAGQISLIPARMSLSAAVAGIVARKAELRQERLSGIHNPWGHGIALTDPWSFLEVCESDLVVNAARALLGPDVILWDSELFPETRRYAAFLEKGKEGRYWPVSPLAGAVLLLPLGRDALDVTAAKLNEVGSGMLDGFDAEEPVFVIRLIPATSHFSRDPEHPANRLCMEEQVLLNYANRPLWLISGVDRAGNDLVTGFAPAVPVWASGVVSAAREEK
jgi:hypothetical protein